MNEIVRELKVAAHDERLHVYRIAEVEKHVDEFGRDYLNVTAILTRHEVLSGSFRRELSGSWWAFTTTRDQGF